MLQDLTEEAKDQSHNADKAGNHGVETLMQKDILTAELLQVNEFSRMSFKREWIFYKIQMSLFLLIIRCG